MTKPKCHLFAPEGAEVFVNGERVWTSAEIGKIFGVDTCMKCEYIELPNEDCFNGTCINFSGWEPKE